MTPTIVTPIASDNSTTSDHIFQRLTMVLRTESECSDFTDLENAGVEPLTLEDITFSESYVNNELRYHSIRKYNLLTQF